MRYNASFNQPLVTGDLFCSEKVEQKNMGNEIWRRNKGKQFTFLALILVRLLSNWFSVCWSSSIEHESRPSPKSLLYCPMQAYVQLYRSKGQDWAFTKIMEARLMIRIAIRSVCRVNYSFYWQVYEKDLRKARYERSGPSTHFEMLDLLFHIKSVSLGKLRVKHGDCHSLLLVESL